MSIALSLKFSATQLSQFAGVFKSAREAAGLTQMEVARKAFRYQVSHCKVSRVERCAMPHVDAHALELMAKVLHVPRSVLEAIDPFFSAKLRVIREATRSGLWRHRAALTRSHDVVSESRVYATRIPKAVRQAQVAI